MLYLSLVMWVYITVYVYFATYIKGMRFGLYCLWVSHILFSDWACLFLFVTFVMNRAIAVRAFFSSFILAVAVTTSSVAVCSSVEEAFSKATKQAQEAHEAGDYQKCADLFQKAYTLKPSPSLLYNSARCLDFGKSYKDAIDSYERYLEHEDEPTLYKKLIRIANERLEKLRPQLGRVVIAIDPEQSKDAPRSWPYNPSTVSTFAQRENTVIGLSLIRTFVVIFPMKDNGNMRRHLWVRHMTIRGVGEIQP